MEVAAALAATLGFTAPVLTRKVMLLLMADFRAFAQVAKITCA